MSNGRKLRRSKSDKMIAGVAGGVAAFFDIDSTVVRIVWALTVIFGGFGLILYLIMWIIVPEEGHDRTVANDVVDSVNEALQSEDEGSEEPAEDE